MATTLARADVRTIALALASSGRTSRFGYLAPNFQALEIGECLILDDDDLTKYDENLVGIVAKAKDSVAFSSDDRAKMRNVLAALIRELRKIHGDSADLRSVYCMVDEEPHYGVERVK